MWARAGSSSIAQETGPTLRGTTSPHSEGRKAHPAEDQLRVQWLVKTFTSDGFTPRKRADLLDQA